MCNLVTGWTPEQVQSYLAALLHEIHDPKRKLYFIRRIVYGRKPAWT